MQKGEAPFPDERDFPSGCLGMFAVLHSSYICAGNLWRRKLSAGRDLFFPVRHGDDCGGYENRVYAQQAGGGSLTACCRAVLHFDGMDVKGSVCMG